MKYIYLSSLSVVLVLFLVYVLPYIIGIGKGNDLPTSSSNEELKDEAVNAKDQVDLVKEKIELKKSQVKSELADIKEIESDINQ